MVAFFYLLNLGAIAGRWWSEINDPTVNKKSKRRLYATI